MPSSHLAQPSLMTLISEVGWTAKLILLLLSCSSVACWAIIINKWKKLYQAQDQNQKFIAVFWAGKNLEEVLGKTDRYPDSPVASVFKSGVKELKKLSSNDPSIANTEKLESIHRALMRTASSEISQLENHINWLATTASAAPFIGLFGTVWGIMNAFQSIGATGGANLAIVAPGISEALITTATGIAAAIPAVIFYNHFANQIKKLAIEMDCFTQDLVNIIQRSFLNSKRG